MTTGSGMPAHNDLSGEVILVTGATDGLGRAVAHELSGRGAELLLHGRNDQRGSAVIAEIREQTGNDRLSWYRADFADLEQVRDLAQRILDGRSKLTVLLNNAGLGVDPVPHISVQGHELTFQVDYLAPYMLGYLLAPLLARSAPARIVTVTSAGQAPIDFGDVMLKEHFDPVQAYCQAKLAEIMMTFDLAGQLPADRVTVNCLHPASMMPTKIVTHMFTPMSRVEDGVRATVRAVTDPALTGTTGRYFNQQREARANAQAYDTVARARLRELAERLTRVPPTVDLSGSPATDTPPATESERTA